MPTTERNLKLKRGKWVVDISFSEPNGKLKRLRAAFATKTEAQAHLTLVRSRKASRRLGIEVPDEVRSSEVLFKDFAEKIISQKRDIRAETIKGLRTCLNGLLATDVFSKKNLSEITVDDCRKYQADLSDRPTAANAGIAFLKMVLGEAIDRGEIVRNPAAKIDRLKTSKGRIRILTDKEIDLLMGACEARLVPLVRLLLATGMRPHEAFSLRWEFDGWDTEKDLDKAVVSFDRKAIFIPGLLAKNHRDREVPLGPDLLEMFRDLRRESTGAKVFPWVQSPLCFGEAVRAAKLKNVSLYTLKHTAASTMINKDRTDIVTVMELLGHSDIKTTMIYCHSDGASKREAVEKASLRYFKSVPVADGQPSAAGPAPSLEGKVN